MKMPSPRDLYLFAAAGAYTAAILLISNWPWQNIIKAAVCVAFATPLLLLLSLRKW